MAEILTTTETALAAERMNLALPGKAEGALLSLGKAKRRRLWINAQFQRRFLISIILLEAEVACVTAGLLSLGWVFMLSGEDTGSGLPRIDAAVFFVLFAVALLVTSGFLAVYVSHRICGPVYRVMQSLKALQRGETPPPIRLRKGDDFWDLAETVNETIEIMKSRQTSVGAEKV